jgi:imidazolonepropionase
MTRETQSRVSLAAAEQTLFVNASQVVTCEGPGRARRGAEMTDAQVRTDVVVAVEAGRVAAVDSLQAIRDRYPRAPEFDCEQRVLMPGLVDSHTHAIFGRPRFEEQEMRAAGLDYMEIARRGGGIHSSVRDLRSRSEEELLTLARRRLLRLASFGTTTVEVKSGYGLTLDDEMKTLRVIERLRHELPMRIVPTFLGAHEIPLEHRGSAAARQAYVDVLIHEMIPAPSSRRRSGRSPRTTSPPYRTKASPRSVPGPRSPPCCRGRCCSSASPNRRRLAGSSRRGSPSRLPRTSTPERRPRQTCHSS